MLTSQQNLFVEPPSILNTKPYLEQDSRKRGHDEQSLKSDENNEEQESDEEIFQHEDPNFRLDEDQEMGAQDSNDRKPKLDLAAAMIEAT